MYLNSLKPAKGSTKAPNGYWPRHRLRQWQNCGSRSQGTEVAFRRRRARRLRRRPNAAADAPAQVRLYLAQGSLFGRGAPERNRNLGLDEINLKALREANLVPAQTRKAKIILSGELKRKVSVDASVGVTKGARAAIEAAGGKVAHRCSVGKPSAQQLASSLSGGSLSELRKRIFSSSWRWSSFRIGTFIPVPGIDVAT